MTDHREFHPKDLTDESAVEERPDSLTVKEYRELLTQLQSIPAAVPSEDMTRRLIETLRPYVPERRFRDRLQLHNRSVTSRAAAIIDAVRPQVGLLGCTFWLASGVLVLLLQLTAWWATSDFGLAVVVTSPAIAVAGVSFAFRGRRTGLGEVERACPVDPITVAYARFIVVTAYDALLIGAMTLIAHLGPVEFGVGPLMLSWLSPFLCFGTLSLLLALHWDGVTASVVGMAVWAVLVGIHLHPVAFDVLAMPGSPDWFWGKAALLFISGLCTLMLSRRALWQKVLEAG